MRAKFINEIRFERNVDPKKALNLGVITWENLSKGDILVFRKKTFLNKSRLQSNIKNSDTEINIISNQIYLKTLLFLGTWRLKNLSTMINFKNRQVEEISLSVQEDKGTGEEVTILILKIL